MHPQPLSSSPTPTTSIPIATGIEAALSNGSTFSPDVHGVLLRALLNFPEFRKHSAGNLAEVGSSIVTTLAAIGEDVDGASRLEQLLAEVTALSNMQLRAVGVSSTRSDRVSIRSISLAPPEASPSPPLIVLQSRSHHSVINQLTGDVLHSQDADDWQRPTHAGSTTFVPFKVAGQWQLIHLEDQRVIKFPGVNAQNLSYGIVPHNQNQALFVVGDNQHTVVYDAVSETIVDTQGVQGEAYPLSPIIRSLDGSRLVLQGNRGEGAKIPCTALYDFSRRSILRCPNEHVAVLFSPALSADGSCGYCVVRLSDTSTAVWEIFSGAVTSMPNFKIGYATPIFGPDNLAFIPIHQKEEAIQLFDIATGSLVRMVDGKQLDSIHATQHPKHLALLATAKGGGSSYLVDLAAKTAQEFTGVEGLTHFTAIRYNPNGSEGYVIGFTDQNRYLFDTRTAAPVSIGDQLLYDDSPNIGSIATYNSDGSECYATGKLNGVFHYVDLNARTAVPAEGTISHCYNIAFGAGRVIGVVQDKGSVNLADLKTGKLLMPHDSIKFERLCEPVIQDDGTICVIGEWGGECYSLRITK